MRTRAGSRWVWSAGLLLLTATPAAGQLEISGQVDLVAATGYDQPLNRNFRDDDPFNDLRLRVFVRHWVTDRIAFFGEFLYDHDADARMNGAYLVLNEIAGKPWLNSRIGMSPSLVGSFGFRSTYFNQNPLIGVPLLWHYRTALDGGARSSAAELIGRKEANRRGLPILYDACWALVWELSGGVDAFSYGVGVSPGAVSNPEAARHESGVQVLGRVGVEPTVGLRLGLSGVWGPYIGESFSPALQAPLTDSPQDYDELMVGYDLEYSRGRFQLFSEGYLTRWETPEIDEDLEVLGAFVEGRFDFAPGWYVAGRVGALTFSEIEVPGEASQAWDDDVWRTELALGRRIAREVLLKLDWQHFAYSDGDDPDVDVVALQLSAVF